MILTVAGKSGDFDRKGGVEPGGCGGGRSSRACCRSSDDVKGIVLCAVDFAYAWPLLGRWEHDFVPAALRYFGATAHGIMTADFLAMLVRLATGVSAGSIEGWTGKPCVFFANHGSNLDALVIWAALPGEIRRQTSPVAALDYWTQSRLRRWISGKVFNAVLLQRKGRPSDRSHPLQAVFDMLDKGRSIIIFPEGTRSPEGKLLPFKPGIFHLREKYPELVMIPVSLQNLNRILPKGQRVPVPLIGRITVHPPMQKYAGEEREQFLTRARDMVASGLQKYQCDE